jgi:CheY-like chemotaxis protein
MSKQDYLQMLTHLKEVIIVDDDEEFLTIIADALNIYKNYFNIHTAVNGKDALNILHTIRVFDLVVTDLNMPVMDGFELLAYMKRNCPQIPVVLITASGTPKIEKIVKDIGVFRYMEKPIDHPLTRLLKERCYNSMLTNVFINELALHIFKGLGINPKKTDFTQVNLEISNDQIIRGRKMAPVSNITFYRFKKSAVKGNVDVQFQLGVEYFAGKVVTKSDSEAVKWFKKAAEQGHAEAKLYLGHIYLRGGGVDKNESEGVKWVKRAAEQGNDNAQFYLGHMYLSGDGVDKNESEAVKWFKKAAEQGHAGAQENIKKLQQ